MKKTYREKLSFSRDDFRRDRMIMDGAGGAICVPKSNAELAAIREAFGFFGGSNNANTYYPGLTAEDVKPKPEDFVEIPFRLISATIVAGGSWRSTDFSNEKVLQASVDKLANKPVYPNHDSDDIMNVLGLVKTPKWSPSFIAADGKTIPGGIDGIMSLDAKSNPKIVRNVLSGAIFSNSVTVDFEFEPSHTYSDYREFLNAVGTIHKDGKMVTRKVTNVLDYYESSLVWLGADPYAKAIDDEGQLVNIDASSIVEFSKLPKSIQGDYEKSNKFYVNACFSKKDSLSLAERYNFGSGKHTQEYTDMKFEIWLRKILNLSATEEITEEMIAKAALLKEGEVAVVKTDLDAKDTEITSLKKENEEIATLKTAIDTDKVFVEAGKAALTAQRDEVKRLYSLSVDNKTDAAVVATFDSASPEALKGFLNQYAKGMVEKFKGTCKSCKSTDITFQSAELGKEEKTEEKLSDEATTATSYDDIRAKYKDKNKSKTV